MATEHYYNDSGTWRKTKEMYYNDSGTWRKAKELWYNDSGTWRKVFSGAQIVNPLAITFIGSTTLSPSNPSCTLQFVTDGSIVATGNESDVPTPFWYQPAETGIGSSYWIRLTINSGTGPTSGSGTGTWLALSASRNWNWSRSTIGTTSANCTVAIATDSGGSNIVTSDSFNVMVTKEI